MVWGSREVGPFGPKAEKFEVMRIEGRMPYLRFGQGRMTVGGSRSGL